MTVAGLIFSNIHDSAIPELTAMRTMASVPFGCRYRLVDFPLSNMVNSGITKVGIITHNNYRSLMDHIGTGKDWDLARRSGGIKFLPPFITAYENAGSSTLYSTRLEALLGATNFISRCNEDYIVFSDCDVICNIDLSEVLEAHEQKGADLTIVTRPFAPSEAFHPEDMYEVKSDADGRVTEVTGYAPKHRAVTVSSNIMVIRRTFLLGLLQEAMTRGYRDFYRDLVRKIVSKSRVYAYPYEGAFLQITSMESYYACSMRLLEQDVRKGLFNVRHRPVLTKVRNSAPTIYSANAKVSNSYVADGCIIEGTVENSIIFRGVKVGKGTVIRNSILLQDTYTGNNVELNCVITDKNVLIKDGRRLSGHESMPFYIGKGRMV